MMRFGKISAIAMSALLAGTSIAAAANYPAPFVEDGTADVAIVYGADADQLDLAQATAIETDLGVSGEETVSVSGGEEFVLEKSSNKFNFNDALDDIYGDLTDQEMDFLETAEYDDGDIDEDFDQTIDLSSKTLSLFADNDYNNDEPTVGFVWDNGDTILSYEMDFDDALNFSEMEETDMPIFGQEYYVLAASSTQIDVLDASDKTSIAKGETVTVDGHTVEIDYIASDEVIFKVDGVLTDDLAENDYEELDDGSYIVATDIRYEEKESAVSSAVFSIGAGKIELIDGSDIEVDDEDVDGLQASFTLDGSDLDKLTLTWLADGDTYLGEGDSITMPVFETISLAYEGMDYPDDSEIVSFDSGETLTLSGTGLPVDFPIMWWNNTDAALGEEDYPLKVATAIAPNTTWTSPARTANLTGGIPLNVDDRFIVTSIDTDLSDIEMLYYEVNEVENDSGDITVEFEDLIGDDDISFDDLETDDVGDVTIELVAVNGTGGDNQCYVNFTSTSGTIDYNAVVSDMGLIIELPTDVSSVDTSTGADFTLTEADYEEDVGEGRSFTVTVKATDDDNLHVSTHNLTSYDEEESDDKYIGYVPSDLASIFTFDTSGDENDFEIEYFGKEATATVKVLAGGDVETTTAGSVIVTDSEVSSMSDKNLIVVGGSCINSVAAELLGSGYCGAAFTSETGVGTGEFLIESFESPYDANKVALLVAGYDAADTVNAATALTTQTVDTSVGNKYTGSTATSMEAVMA